jgi:hypothetical protein
MAVAVMSPPFIIMKAIISMALLSAIFITGPAVSQQKPVASYPGLAPAENALVKRAEASRWRDTSSRQIQGSIGSPNQFQSAVQGKNCTTQIGGSNADGDSSDGRFGPGKITQDVVVVTGSVINICK